MSESKVDIARAYIEKFIELGLRYNRGYSKREIAAQMALDRPDVFKNIELARDAVRRATAAVGSRRPYVRGHELARRFALIENGAVELENPEPYIIPEKFKRSLWMADLHSRFCDRDALRIAIDYGIEKKCDSVVILGDFMDFYGSSRFDKSPNVLEYFQTENEWGAEVLSLLQDTFGQVFLKKGNHDIRREQRIGKMSLQFPELSGVQTYAECLSFPGSRVEIIEDYRVVKFGRLNGIHGHEYQGGGGIHVAYNRGGKAMDNVISAHSHIAQSDMRKTIDGSVIVSTTLGCLCNLHPRYNPMNSWTQGFAVVERDSDGHFMIDNRVIVNGRAYPR